MPLFNIGFVIFPDLTQLDFTFGFAFDIKSSGDNVIYCAGDLEKSGSGAPLKLKVRSQPPDKTGKINREFRRIRLLSAILKADTRANSKASSEIPYSTKQGIFAKEQGICTREQGI